jgi:hypothetical protein
MTICNVGSYIDEWENFSNVLFFCHVHDFAENALDKCVDATHCVLDVNVGGADCLVKNGKYSSVGRGRDIQSSMCEVS